MLKEPWRITLFGGLSAQSGERVISRFSTRKTAALLAYLALHRNRTHPREELIERFWPEVDPESGRVSLRQALASLRRQLEEPPVPPGSVVFADRSDIRLQTSAITTDVEAFEAALHAAEKTDLLPARIEALVHADSLYRGDLLPGFYEDWILLLRERLAEMHRNGLRQLAAAYQQRGETEHAIDCAHRAVIADMLDEEAHLELMRLYIDAGRPADALQQYATLTHVLQENLQVTPGPDAQQLIASLRTSPRSVRLASQAPSLASTSSASSPPPDTFSPRLPVRLTRFFGRETEITELVALLTGSGEGRGKREEGRAHLSSASELETPGSEPGHRNVSLFPLPSSLITLLGPGGSGKTRLALEVAERALSFYGNAVWFVPLSDLADPRWLPDAIRDAMHLPRTPGLAALEQVIAHLQTQPSLLVLDNFEHLATRGVSIIKVLLTRIPSLVCLVTSQRRLTIPGERVFPVPPLPTPDTLPPTPDALMACSSVQIFVDRAQAVRPDFAVTQRNAEAVAGLCARLEGVPLALELAAAWTGALTPHQILERLTERFALLTARRADKTARHRSLWATIDWSYRLLPPDLQRLFTRLFVFRGGWTLEAAETVCEAPDALLALEQLRERSLVVVEESEAEMRYRMLETLREFAAEQWNPEEQDEQRGRHLAYFLALAEKARDHFTRPGSAAWLDRIEAEHDNLRAALTWGLQHAPEEALNLAGALWLFWYTRGYLAEGQRWLEETAAGENLPALDRARAHNAAGIIARDRADYARAEALCQRALTVFRAEGADRNIADALSYLGMITGDQGEFEASYAYLEEALALYRQIEDDYNVARTLNALGMTASQQGDFDTTIAVCTESLAYFRAQNAPQGLAFVLNTLGCAYYARHEYDIAQSLHEECLALQRQLGSKRGVALSLSNLGATRLRSGAIEQAGALYNESLLLFGEVGDRWGIALTLERAAHLALLEKNYLHAAQLLGATAALRSGLQEESYQDSPPDHLAHLMTEAQNSVGEAAWTRAFTLGKRLSYEQAITLARSQPALSAENRPISR